MDQVVDLYLSQSNTRQRWENFLSSLDLHNFSDREVAVIDHTIGLINEEGKLVGTGSIAGNVLKYVGVSNTGETNGARFNKIVTALQQYLFNEKIFHSFVFTKAKYAASFQHLGFNELARSEQAAFLESGTPDVHDYLAGLPKRREQRKMKVAAIVMNANPFTLGHRHLVEVASAENELVYVFVVATDLSLFKTKERARLVKKGLQDLANVVVVSGGDYMVSAATFPAYFLPSPADVIKVQTTIDARVFKNIIAPSLNIKCRYIGQEPQSRTTNYYNTSLVRELEPDIKVRILSRYQVEGKMVTGSWVRQDIRAGKLGELKNLVPRTTFNFIKNNLKRLQRRIEKGMKINGN